MLASMVCRMAPETCWYTPLQAEAQVYCGDR